MVIDYSFWSIYEGASEGSGRSEKVWLTNEQTKEIGLFKFPKSNNTMEHISEKLASDLAGLLGMECAKIEIGKYKSRVGSMSYKINKDKEALIEGIYLINKLYPNYNPNTMYDNIEKEYYSLEMILDSLFEYNLENEFLKIVIFDSIIGNTDRHQNNWAVLQLDNSIRLCPLYDNGSSLCCYLEEGSIDAYLGKDRNRFKSLVESKSRSRIRIDKKSKKEPTHLQVLKYINQNFSEYVYDFIVLINDSITIEALDKILSAYSNELISDKRKKLIKLFLMEKVKLMNDIFSREEE